MPRYAVLVSSGLCEGLDLYIRIYHLAHYSFPFCTVSAQSVFLPRGYEGFVSD